MFSLYELINDIKLLIMNTEQYIKGVVSSKSCIKKQLWGENCFNCPAKRNSNNRNQCWCDWAGYKCSSDIWIFILLQIFKATKLIQCCFYHHYYFFPFFFFYADLKLLFFWNYKLWFDWCPSRLNATVMVSSFLL